MQQLASVFIRFTRLTDKKYQTLDNPSITTATKSKCGNPALFISLTARGHRIYFFCALYREAQGSKTEPTRDEYGKIYI